MRGCSRIIRWRDLAIRVKMPDGLTPTCDVKEVTMQLLRNPRLAVVTGRTREGHLTSRS